MQRRSAFGGSNFYFGWGDFHSTKMSKFLSGPERCGFMRRTHRGFTLVELLIVLAILLVLFGLVITVFQTNQGTDRMRAAARQLQSSILGARDRALHEYGKNKSGFDTKPIYRGLRLIPDSTDPSVATSFIYVTSLEPWTGNVSVGRPDVNGDGSADDNNNSTIDGNEDVVRTIRGVNTGWLEEAKAGIIKDGNRIRIGSWYTISLSRMRGADGKLGTGDDVDNILVLTADYRTTGIVWPARDAHTNQAAVLERTPTPSPGEQPITLPSNCVVDLDNSRIPRAWWNSSTGLYAENMDIMFSPRGTVQGPNSAEGIFHFVIAETNDTVYKLAGDSSSAKSSSIHKSRATSRTIPPECTQGEKLIVTVFARTGAVSTHPVDVYSVLGTDQKAGTAGTNDDSDADTDELADTSLPDPEEIGYGDDDPRQRFRYAEIGSSAGK